MSRKIIQGKKKYKQNDNEDGVNSRSLALVERVEGMKFHLRQLRAKEYCDVILRTTSDRSMFDGILSPEPIYCHQIVLKSASPYFEALLVSDDPTKIGDYLVEGIDRSTLEFLLDCIYYCNVEPIDEANMFTVCAGAKLLELPAIQGACEVLIEHSRTVNNCLQIWNFGKQQNCQSLSDSDTFILENFAAVSNTPDFINLAVSEMDALIASALNQPMIISTNDLLLSLHKWVINGCEMKSDPRRIQAFLSFVRKLSTEEISKHIFAQVFLEDPHLKDDPECQRFRDDYLCDFFRRHIRDQQSNGSASPKISPAPPPPLKKSERIRTPSVKVKVEPEDIEIVDLTAPVGRKGRGRPKAPKTQDTPSSDGHSHSHRSTSSATATPPAPKRAKKGDRSVVHFSSAPDGSHCMAYYTTKKGNDWVINSFDFQTGVSGRVANFLHYRENGVLLMVNNLIYFLGGRAMMYGGPGTRPGEDSNKIDVYDTNTGEWNCSGELLEMDEGRSFFNCVLLNNHIYIVAGFREDACIDSVERIAIGSTVLEEEVTNVRWAKNRSPLAILKGKIYSVGGIVAEGNKAAFASDFAEVYNPAKNKWSNISRMHTARVGHALVALGSKLYALGGGKSEEPVDALKLATVEMYDPDKNTWNFVSSMHKKRQFGTAVAFGGFIYALAGDSERNPTVERYDPNQDGWEMVHTTLPPDSDYTSMIFQIQNKISE